ncbi:MAG: DUF1269 domain-containing protein [Acidimicrobiales bacterium]
MSDQTTNPGQDVTVVAAQVADDQGVIAQGAIAAEGDHALIVARFADTQSAITIYDRLLDAEIDGSLHIDSVLVAKADDDGRIHIQKMTEHSTRKGLKWGIVGGVVAGIFLPVTVVGGAVYLGVTGALVGKTRNLYHRVEVEKELTDVITAGTSGILCLVSAAHAEDVAKKMPEAQAIKTVPVDEATAGDIKAAAVAAEGKTPAAEAPAAG